MTRIAIVGGGASGFFAAIRAAELAKAQGAPARIAVFDSSPSFLNKVKISGGGRCNVTHHQFDPAIFCQNYPRGKRELRSPFSQFQAQDTVAWFKEKGVKLTTEKDGRMFPVTNSSETIINCFISAAIENDVKMLARSRVESVSKQISGEFHLVLKNGESWTADKVLLATGSSPSGHALAKSLGHVITELAPSLFSFKIKRSFIHELPGTSFPKSIVNLRLPEGKRFIQGGPLLITHRGLSGPVILRLSAWAAREMKRADYKASLSVSWLGLEQESQARSLLNSIKEKHGKTYIKNAIPPEITKRFWLAALESLDIDAEKNWADLSKKEMNKLVEFLFATPLEVQGQNRFKEEFVECGGVKLSEIDLKTMKSKVCPGLFFSGEILDIDGITGGFNFQNAWTTGFIAGSNMVKN